MNDDDRYRRTTRLLDFAAGPIRGLVQRRGWAELPVPDRIGAAYDFVRDEIRFGYNRADDLPASAVLTDGQGQCNTKATLLAALLRALGVESRIHGATIDKRLQRGAVTGLAYWLAPRRILHSWVEVRQGERWVALEGVILDRAYLEGVRAHVDAPDGALIGYAVGTDDLADPPIEWRGTDTAIQKTGVVDDFGVFDDPDALYAAHGTNLSGIQRWLFEHWVRPRMNRNVARLRECVVCPLGAGQPAVARAEL